MSSYLSKEVIKTCAISSITGMIPYCFKLTITQLLKCATDGDDLDINVELTDETREIARSKIIDELCEITDSVKNLSPVNKIACYRQYIDRLVCPIPEYLRTAPETYTVMNVCRMELIAIILYKLKKINHFHPDAKIILLN